MAVSVKSYADAVNLFMPKNLAYLFSYSKSPLRIEDFHSNKCKSIYIIRLPRQFSVIKNPKESYAVLKKTVEALVCQKGEEVWIDYNDCQDSDLITQLFLDVILKDWDTFVKLCIRADITRYLKVRAIGGRNYNNPAIQRMLNSVGSPTILLNRQFGYKEIIPFNLRYLDKQDEKARRMGVSDDIDSGLLIEYVNDCLNRVGKKLTEDAAADLGYVIAEPMINASEHSSLKSRYLIGYFEDISNADDIDVHGVLNLVILNFGKSIYEKFKYPDDNEKINSQCVLQMTNLSDSFRRKRLFAFNDFKESTLWTLYALQQGVTIVPNANRGNGTIQFIDKFFNLRQGDEANESRMYLMSGNTIIEFDGSYGLNVKYDDEGNKTTIMPFNKIGSLHERPDSKYVRHTDNFFPGTAIYARITLNSALIQNDLN